MALRRPKAPAATATKKSTRTKKPSAKAAAPAPAPSKVSKTTPKKKTTTTTTAPVQRPPVTLHLRRTPAPETVRQSVEVVNVNEEEDAFNADEAFK